MTRPLPFEEARHAAARRRGEGAFSSFFERDALREKRRRGRRFTLIVSVAVHLIALAVLVVYSIWQVEELFGPAVKVRMMPGPAGASTSPPVPAAPAGPLREAR